MSAIDDFLHHHIECGKYMSDWPSAKCVCGCAEAAAELAALRAENERLARNEKHLERCIEAQKDTLILHENVNAQLRAENERLTKAVEEAMETIEKVKGSVVGDRRPKNDLSNTYSRLAIANSCDEWLTAHPKEEA